MSEKATFAAGCFWGVEAHFRKIKGVLETEVGYTGGHTADPSYETVCTDKTGHAEAVQVVFDPQIVSYKELLDAFWNMHDPTTKNAQGLDIGSQYRSAIFTHSESQEKEAKASKENLIKQGKKVVTEILPITVFYRAEEYHQRYHEKHGGSCGI